MLDIKQARPKETYDAVYVTKDNVDEFISLVHYGERPISIDRFDSKTVYRYERFSYTAYHDCWYTRGTDPDNVGWESQISFDEDYEVVDEV